MRETSPARSGAARATSRGSRSIAATETASSASNAQGLVEHGLEGEGVWVLHGIRTAHFSRMPRPQSNAGRAGSLIACSPVRVAIDARALLQERTGIGTYTLRDRPGPRGAPGRRGRALRAPPPSARPLDGSEAFRLHTDHHPFGIVWLQTTLPQRLARWGADVLRLRADDRAGARRRPLRLGRPRPDAPDAPRVARRRAR